MKQCITIESNSYLIICRNCGYHKKNAFFKQYILIKIKHLLVVRSCVHENPESNMLVQQKVHCFFSIRNKNKQSQYQVKDEIRKAKCVFPDRKTRLPLLRLHLFCVIIVINIISFLYIIYSLAVLVLLLFYLIFAFIKSGLVFILCLDSFCVC